MFPTDAVTASGPSHTALIQWADEMHTKYPDGEDAIINLRLNEMTAQFFNGMAVPQPSNKYAIEAVAGFLIMLRGFRDHGVQF